MFVPPRLHFHHIPLSNGTERLQNHLDFEFIPVILHKHSGSFAGEVVACPDNLVQTASKCQKCMKQLRLKPTGALWVSIWTGWRLNKDSILIFL